MMRTVTLPAALLVALVYSAGAASSLRADEADSQLANEAFTILKQHCYKCHGTNYEVPGLNILDREVLTKLRPNTHTYVVPGEPDDSELWVRLGISGDMPPEKVKDRPSAEQIATIKKWIEAGAPFPRETGRPFISEGDVQRKIVDHLRSLPANSRPFQRYFTLTNVHNNPKASNSDLRMYRAAFVKLLNSLSRTARLITPKLIDAPANNPHEGVIFNLDLRDIGWEVDAWREAIAEYPYGVRWNDLQELAGDLDQLTGGSLVNDGIPYIRVDWFVANASRPPAYHKLLGIPDTAAELERKLGINSQRDFREDRLKRAGFAGSGVSKHNRLVDRHEGENTQYYYHSYDFGKSFGRGVLSRFPLGPKFETNPFNETSAFEHDGGEIIYSLPNGMQGYMIVDKDGKRLDEAPIDVVRDLNEFAGTPQVVNGISCIGCHKHGMLDFKDSIRGSFVLAGEGRLKVDRLFAPSEEFERLVEADRSRFMFALDQLIGPYLKQGLDADRNIRDFPEPVTLVSRWYQKDLSLEDVAFELGYDKGTQLGLAGNQKLQELGLGPLASGGTVPRSMWDSREEASVSLFQRAFFALGLGSGKNPPQ